MSLRSMSRKRKDRFQFTQADLEKIFPFEDYRSNNALVQDSDYKQFLKSFVKPKIRGLAHRRLCCDRKLDQQKVDWELFREDVRASVLTRVPLDFFNTGLEILLQVMAEFPICRRRREWLFALQAYAKRYMSDCSAAHRRPKKPMTSQALPPRRPSDNSSSTSLTLGRSQSQSSVLYSVGTDDPGAEQTSSSPVHAVIDLHYSDSSARNDHGTRDVAHFLTHHCRPPLPHLFPTFLNLGIKSKDDLMRVSSWKDEDLRDALDTCLANNLLSFLSSKTLFVAFTDLRRI
ncbi:hypothetical protein FPV67DRAFT_1464039 [Lyophyllum atratum]|nr:hypothetical protein FPV67DRAFT_1464039 [Lyophyllum atratum]